MKRILDFLVLSEPYLLVLIGLVLVTLCSSCAAPGGSASANTRSFTTSAATTAIGGYVGAKEGDGKAKNAALGAAAGFVLGETINYFSHQAQRDAYLAGYEKGQSNAVKQQYWIARDNQRPRPDDGYEEGFYQIDVPPSHRDGVRREPTTRVIRVVMPRETP